MVDYRFIHKPGVGCFVFPICSGEFNIVGVAAAEKQEQGFERGMEYEYLY